MPPRAWEELKSFFKTLIGNTSDTGGTAAAGSLMAKANAILNGQAKQAQQETVQSILSKLNTSGAITVNAVKSVQRGTVIIGSNSAEGRATINAVNMSKAVVLYGGVSTSNNNSAMAQTALSCLRLDNQTTVVAARYIGWQGEVSVPFQVMEFY